MTKKVQAIELKRPTAIIRKVRALVDPAAKTREQWAQRVEYFLAQHDGGAFPVPAAPKALKDDLKKAKEKRTRLERELAKMEEDSYDNAEAIRDLEDAIEKLNDVGGRWSSDYVEVNEAIENAAQEAADRLQEEVDEVDERNDDLDECIADAKRELKVVYATVAGIESLIDAHTQARARRAAKKKEAK